MHSSLSDKRRGLVGFRWNSFYIDIWQSIVTTLHSAHLSFNAEPERHRSVYIRLFSGNDDILSEFRI
jgi:hypothetical protein